jgi:eukaryotic-like serine/threonine-protein kinase
VMLYQMLTGELPFKADSIARLMYQIANEPAPDIRSMRPELPEALAAIVAKALNKAVGERYQDGEKFAADLRAVAAQLEGSPIPVASASVPPTVAGEDPYAKTVVVESVSAFAKTVEIPAYSPLDGPEAGKGPN